MLKDRVIATLRFFNFQDLPLTLFELHNFLLGETEEIKKNLDVHWELGKMEDAPEPVQISIDQVLRCLDGECKKEVICSNGYYALAGREEIIRQRLANYIYGIKRERLIRRFMPFVKTLPFVRGVALAGSQALGQQKADSDIDLLIFTDHQYLWLARTFITAYFQLMGKRRRHNKIANRFCLNHYLNSPKEVDRERNLYKAMEYLKLRPLLGGELVKRFQKNNRVWIQFFFPNAAFVAVPPDSALRAQTFGEFLFDNRFGAWLEKKLQDWQLPKIKQDRFTFVTGEELSFHPGSRHEQLLAEFFGNK